MPYIYLSIYIYNTETTQEKIRKMRFAGRAFSVLHSIRKTPFRKRQQINTKHGFRPESYTCAYALQRNKTKQNKNKPNDQETTGSTHMCALWTHTYDEQAHQRPHNAQSVVHAALRLIQHETVRTAHQHSHGHPRRWYTRHLDDLRSQQ